jgi:hypothetical protein
MRNRPVTSIGVAAAIVSALVLFRPTQVTVAQQTSDAALKTPWGEPDLQGIWTDESDTPLQRSP